MYRLSTSMPFLLARVGVRLGELFSRRLATYDLTLPMYRVLAALSERPDQKLGELSAATTVEMSTMSRLVGAMSARGLVSRLRQPGNERTVRINLTAKGAELAASVRHEAEHYEDVAISVLDSGDVQRLKATLARIYAALDVLEEELVALKPAGYEGAPRRDETAG